MSTKLRSLRRRAFTLVEMLVAIGISAIVFTVIAYTTSYSVRSMIGLWNYAELNRSSMHALDIITRDVRQMDSVTDIGTNFVALAEVTDTGTNTLVFVWEPDEKTLWRHYNTNSTLLLTNCNSLMFSGYKRNPISGEYNYYPESSNPKLIKLIQVTWVCSRNLFRDDKRNTESVQTAKIVIRQQ